MQAVQTAALKKSEDDKRLRKVRRAIRISATFSFASWMFMVITMNWAVANDIMTVNLMFGISSVTGLLLAIVMTALGCADESMDIANCSALAAEPI